MKKIYIIGIVLALVFSITGCGIRETKNADKQESTVSTETKRQEPLRIYVGMIWFVGTEMILLS